MGFREIKMEKSLKEKEKEYLKEMQNVEVQHKNNLKMLSNINSKTPIR